MRKSKKPMKRYIAGWIIGFACLSGLLIAAFMTYEILKPEVAIRQNGGDLEMAELCATPGVQDHGWRWYTRNYPSPDKQWRIFVVGNTLCFGTDRKWKGFAIDQGQVRKYGCFATYAGLFCQRSADPMKHPKAAEHFG